MVAKKNKLLGKYKPPRVRKGDTLFDERFGEVVVVDFTQRMQWPIMRHRNGVVSPIVCGDLIRALHYEATKTIAYWWEISRHTIHKWKKAVGAEAYTEGTHYRWGFNTPTEECKQKAAHACRRPKHRRAVGERKKEEWAQMRASGAGKAWTEKELALLGTDTDQAIAQKLGRHPHAVACTRRYHGILPASTKGRMVECTVCGKQFRTKKPGQCRGRALCSDKCRRRKNAQRSRQWRVAQAKQ